MCHDELAAQVIDGILTVTDAGTASDNQITLSIDDQSLLITDVVNGAGAAGLGSSEVADVNGAGKRKRLRAGIRV